MAKIRFKISSPGVREFMNSTPVQTELFEHAQKVQSRAGAGYEVSIQAGKARAHARVATVTEKAVRENLRNNTLLKALGGA